MVLYVRTTRGIPLLLNSIFVQLLLINDLDKKLINANLNDILGIISSITRRKDVSSLFRNANYSNPGGKFNMPQKTRINLSDSLCHMCLD